MIPFLSHQLTLPLVSSRATECFYESALYHFPLSSTCSCHTRHTQNSVINTYGPIRTHTQLKENSLCKAAATRGNTRPRGTSPLPGMLVPMLGTPRQRGTSPLRGTQVISLLRGNPFSWHARGDMWACRSSCPTGFMKLFRVPGAGTPDIGERRGGGGGVPGRLSKGGWGVPSRVSKHAGWCFRVSALFVRLVLHFASPLSSGCCGVTQLSARRHACHCLHDVPFLLLSEPPQRLRQWFDLNKRTEMDNK